MHVYNEKFFRNLREGTSSSAGIVVKHLLELTQPKSVIDIGCGSGTWLSEFVRLGINDVVGVDGHYVNRDHLLIDPRRFIAHDLSVPFRTQRRFDLALCLEVAEHLPPEAAETIVETLVRLSSIIYFSAAIPLQGGTHHVNEEWQSEWAVRFRNHGFHPVDQIRKALWDNRDVLFFYPQNGLLYVDERLLRENPKLHALHHATDTSMISVVHPEFIKHLGIRQIVTSFPKLVKQAIDRRKEKPPER